MNPGSAVPEIVGVGLFVNEVIVVIIGTRVIDVSRTLKDVLPIKFVLLTSE